MSDNDWNKVQAVAQAAVTAHEKRGIVWGFPLALGLLLLNVAVTVGVIDWMLFLGVLKGS